ncbi:MAG: tRNA pseudouridine(55) synthase TruB [Vicinamibacterales bacterium]
MHGVLVIDKPPGLTSHDVVATARRAFGEPRIGHTGTLDPMATGVLPLACGAATRLARFLAGADKDYDAEIRVGLETDTYDVTGREVARSDRRPSAEEIVAALRTLTGGYLQAPPPFSAKKIGGRRAYELARAGVVRQPAPTPVCVTRLELVGVRGNVLSLRLTSSAGFYVRSLAHELGKRLETGACLQALRRTRSGEFTLSHAVAMEALAGPAAVAGSRLLPMERLLPGLPAVTVTPEGLSWVSHGRAIAQAQAAGPLPEHAPWVRLMGQDGALVALAEPGVTPGSLHPSVVLI